MCAHQTVSFKLCYTYLCWNFCGITCVTYLEPETVYKFWKEIRSCFFSLWHFPIEIPYLSGKKQFIGAYICDNASEFKMPILYLLREDRQLIKLCCKFFSELLNSISTNLKLNKNVS